ncbi:hypothetical protein BC831DRAFT_470864, partial [Entophlyctis helioformis]
MGRRRTTQAALQSNPEPAGTQCIGKVLEIRGGGLYVVAVPSTDAVASAAAPAPSDPASASQPPAGTTTLLVSMPSKFQKLIWVKKSNFVIIEPIADSTTKVKGEILHILFADNIKYLQSIGKWPAVFATGSAQSERTATMRTRTRAAKTRTMTTICSSTETESHPTLTTI